MKEDENAVEEEVLVNPAFPNQKVITGTQFSSACRKQLINLLRDNQDVFAWQPSDMAGVPRRIIQHSLNVNMSVTPVAQKRRFLGSEKSKTVMKEVEEWIKADIVRPVQYPTWISNPDLVKKADETWRMCIDFKNVNLACPKDYYPLTEIDLKIEAVMGFLFKCFLDAYKGYHQIQMSKEDKEKITFYTDQGTYYYIKMPFGLKNAGATYQRLVDSAFQTQLGRNLEAYVDDMVIKSKTEQEMIINIAETFDNLKKVNIKLKPKKCSFGVKEGKFLGYVVTSERIQANPKKTKAVADMQSPRTLKEYNKDDFRWTDEAEQAFQEMKKLILELPTLTTPGLKETLYVYLAISKDAVSGVLIADRGGKQTPIRLRRYFEAHPIKVITDQPIKQILNKPEVSEKLAKYAVELGAYNITYIPRNAVKGQILADFLNEIPVGTKHAEICSLTDEGLEEWTLFTDGASSLKGAGAGLVLIDPIGTEYTYAIRLNFASTNNEAEYEALLAGLRITEKMKVKALKVKVDSKLVACQLNREFVASSEGMAKYLAKAKELSALFEKFAIENVPQSQNQKAYVLSKLASVAFNHLMKEVLVEVINEKSVDAKEVSTIIEDEEDNWMTPIIRCLKEGVWSEDENEARTLRMKIGQYTLMEGVLFKRSYLSLMLRCVGLLQENYIIREVHEGACGIHPGARSVVAKIMRQGYYWPSMHRDTKEGPGKLKFIIVAIDYFTKWMEAKPLAKTTGKEVKKFVWENIICWFGLPRVIVTDNGTQLVNDPFKSWCEKWEIKQMNMAVAHPQANGLVERANKSLMHGLKARLGRERVGWLDELPNILWAHRTMLKTSSGETPFSLTYGSEAVIPAEIGMPTYRII
ncbi:reverse transcriptase domain-containing protein [Tanacetum coccineum]